jgi:hypothetical protein
MPDPIPSELVAEMRQVPRGQGHSFEAVGPNGERAKRVVPYGNMMNDAADLIERLTSAPAGAEEAAYAWLEGKYLNVETGDDPADRAFDQEEMVDAFIAGLSSAPPPSPASPITNGQQSDSDYTAGADLARNIASYVSNQVERRNCYLAARNILNELLASPVARVPAITVKKIETVTGDYMIDPGEPFWRIEINGYCADFDYEQAAENFASAIRALFTASPSDRSGEGK